MRKATRDDLTQMVRAAVAAQVSDARRVIMNSIEQASEGALSAIEKIQPASVDLTQEMADDIVRKIHGPLTIGKGFSDWIRQEAPVRDIFWVTQIGYGSTAGQMHVILKTNGTLQLEMRDHLGATMWHGTFVPPDFGVSDETG